MPSIPAIARDIKASPSAINYTVAIFLVCLGVTPLLWAPLSGFYGRRPIYLASMPIHIAASIGVAFSNNLGALIGTRILQAIGRPSAYDLTDLQARPQCLLLVPAP